MEMAKRLELERRGKEPKEVVELNLDNCRSSQIEGLSDAYVALESLSMINVGLTSLKGFPALPKLKKLELSDNRLQGGLEVLQNCPQLEALNFGGNKIKDIQSLQPLKKLAHLMRLDLMSNPVVDSEEYRSKLFELLPQLKYLDGADVNGKEDEDDDEEQNGEVDDDELEDEGEEEEDEDDDEEDEDDEEEEEEGPGLSALYKDGQVLDDDEEDYKEEEDEAEDDDDEVDEDEEEDDKEEDTSSEPKEKRVKLQSEEGNGDGAV